MPDLHSASADLCSVRRPVLCTYLRPVAFLIMLSVVLWCVWQTIQRTKLHAAAHVTWPSLCKAHGAPATRARGRGARWYCLCLEVLWFCDQRQAPASGCYAPALSEGSAYPQPNPLQPAHLDASFRDCSSFASIGSPPSVGAAVTRRCVALCSACRPVIGGPVPSALRCPPGPTLSTPALPCPARSCPALPAATSWIRHLPHVRGERGLHTKKPCRVC